MSENLLEYGVLSISNNDRVLEIELLDDGALHTETSHGAGGRGHCCGIGVILDQEAVGMLRDLLNGERPQKRRHP